MDLFAELKQLVTTLESRVAWSASSREGMIALRLAAGRPQDVAHVKRLEELSRG